MHHSTSEVNVEDIAEQIENALESVKGLLEDWEGVEMEVKEHDFYVSHRPNASDHIESLVSCIVRQANRSRTRSSS